MGGFWSAIAQWGWGLKRCGLWRPLKEIISHNVRTAADCQRVFWGTLDRVFFGPLLWFSHTRILLHAGGSIDNAHPKEDRSLFLCNHTLQIFHCAPWNFLRRRSKWTVKFSRCFHQKVLTKILSLSLCLFLHTHSLHFRFLASLPISSSSLLPYLFLFLISPLRLHCTFSWTHRGCHIFHLYD